MILKDSNGRKIKMDLLLRAGIVFVDSAYYIDTNENASIDLAEQLVDANSLDVSMYFAEQGIDWRG